MAGFRLAVVASHGDRGDAFVHAPDGGAATLAWESGDAYLFRETRAAGPSGRWGGYAVRLPLPLRTDADAAAYLAAVLPELQPRWERWRTAAPAPEPPARLGVADVGRALRDLPASPFGPLAVRLVLLIGAIVALAAVTRVLNAGG